MGKLRILAAFILCCILFCIPVSAASNASLLQSGSVISADGSCQVNLTVNLHLDSAAPDLCFPLPPDAQDILLNGSVTQNTADSDSLNVTIPSVNAGDYTFTISYRLPDVLKTVNKKLTISLPLLNGFEYPIASMEFTVTLPGEITARPSFSSGYHQEGIEAELVTTVEGSTISGVIRQGLKDHETLTMTMDASKEMFPTVVTKKPLLDGWDAAILVCVVLALIYYFVSLFPVIPKKIRCFTPPDGISAGEVGTCLTGAGADLTMMVISWAQLGYLAIQPMRDGRVLLHKHMEMGNERNNFEVRCFQNLFGPRRTVDGTGTHYGRLSRQISGKSPLTSQLFKPNSGNPRIFRILACAAGALSGVSLGLSVTGSDGLKTLLALLFCILCGALSYFIQSGGKCLPLRNKSPMYLALGCGGLWLALGFVTGKLLTVTPMVAFQFLCGFAVAFGGQRSDLGKRCVSQIRSLKSYMVSVQSCDLQRLMQANPNYYYELAPYALVLGVDKKFAKRFGKIPLPDCSFLILDKQSGLTASQWAAQLRAVADKMYASRK